MDRQTAWPASHTHTINSQIFVVMPSADGVELPKSKVVGPFPDRKAADRFNTQHGFVGEIQDSLTPDEYEAYLESWS